jgi:hypothetical protein
VRPGTGPRKGRGRPRRQQHRPPNDSGIPCPCHYTLRGGYVLSQNLGAPRLAATHTVQLPPLHIVEGDPQSGAFAIDAAKPKILPPVERRAVLPRAPRVPRVAGPCGTSRQRRAPRASAPAYRFCSGARHAAHDAAAEPSDEHFPPRQSPVRRERRDLRGASPRRRLMGRRGASIILDSAAGSTRRSSHNHDSGASREAPARAPAPRR